MSTTNQLNKPDVNYEDEHGITFKILFYIACVVTVFMVAYLKPPAIYKKAVSKFLNITFQWRGAYWKMYNILVIFIIIIGFFLFFLTSQVTQFTEDKPSMETHDKKLFRLQHKWLTESEIWLTSLIIFELVTIYRLASLYDKRKKLQELMGGKVVKTKEGAVIVPQNKESKDELFHKNKAE